MNLPTYIDLMLPILCALKELKGEANIADLNQKVQELAGLTEEQMTVTYSDEESQRGSKVEHRMAFARTYLKKLKAIENPDRGIYRLTSEGQNLLELDDPEQEIRHLEHELRVGKTPETFLKLVKQRVEEDDTPVLSVRELLGEWDVRRRGSAVSERIARDLHSRGLTTDPNFSDVAIDDRVEIVAVVKSHANSLGGSDELGEESHEDVKHTITVGNLPSAGAGVVSVTPQDTVVRAQSLMESNDFSQLPVMSGVRTLDGVISWETIAKDTLYSGSTPVHVRDAMESGITPVSADEPLLEYVGVIADAGFVFVTSVDKRITGIVTTADLSAQFAQLANPFLLIGEIERWLRVAVDRNFQPDELLGFVDADDSDRTIEGGDSLTMGEIGRLFENPDAWNRFGWSVEKAVFVDHLDSVRQIRNSIMHFSPDPPDSTELARIDRLLAWVRRLVNIDG